MLWGFLFTSLGLTLSCTARPSKQELTLLYQTELLTQQAQSEEETLRDQIKGLEAEIQVLKKRATDLEYDFSKLNTQVQNE